MGGKVGRVVNMYKGHMDKAKGQDPGEVEMAGVGVVVGENGDNCT